MSTRLITLLIVGLGVLPQTVCAADGLGPSDGATRSILQGPKKVDRYEPSASVVHDGMLYVANDKPFKLGKHRIAQWAVYDLSKLKGDDVVVKPGSWGLIDGADKIEGGAWHPRGGLVWWETKSHIDYRCQIHGQACIVNDIPFVLDRTALQSRVKQAANVPDNRSFCYLTVEGLAMGEGTAWVGIRGYGTFPKDACFKDESQAEFHPWAALVDERGQLAWGKKGFALDAKNDDRLYGISGLALSGDGRKLWTTWSYEGDGATAKDVAGRVGYLELTDGRLDSSAPLQLCATKKNKALELQGKPESISLTSDGFMVIYDNDRNRKDKSGADGKFPLKENQDYIEVFDAASCALTVSVSQ